MKWKQMNRIERIADVIGMIALAAAAVLICLVYGKQRLFLFPAMAGAICVFYLSMAVTVRRHKRSLAVVNLLGAAAMAVLGLTSLL